ncbi:MAG: DUF4168 domain-containing protein [Oceanicaulis sp.]
MIATLLRTTSIAVILAGAAGAGAHALQAGAQQQQPYQQEQQPQIEPVTDTEIEAFVVAVDDASEVFEEYRPALQSATDEQAAQEIQVEAQEEMTAAVLNAGLEVQRYNEIMQAARADAELAQRITMAAEERQERDEAQ